MNTKLKTAIIAALMQAWVVQAQTNTFPSNGNVGIGTTAPVQKLHVVGHAMVQDVTSDSNSNAFLGVKARGTPAAMAVPQGNDRLLYIGAGGYNGVTIANYDKAVINFRAAATWTETSNPTYISFDTTPSGSVSRSEIMRVNHNGRVGVGTTSPNERMHVAQGNLLLSHVAESDTSAGLRGVKARGTVGAPQLPANNDYLFYVSGGGYDGSTLYAYNRALIAFRAAENWTSTANGSYISFETTPNGSTSRARVMRIDPSGKVGIGTTAPSHLLTVNGAIRAKEVVVDTGWADYVFSPDYRLPTLEEVETHILEKRHLPGMPSEAEVRENGIELVKAVTDQMAQIEQLTLHVIALNKQLKAQEKRIQELEAVGRAQ